jgi:hypothetical protein
MSPRLGSGARSDGRIRVKHVPVLLRVDAIADHRNGSAGWAGGPGRQEALEKFSDECRGQPGQEALEKFSLQVSGPGLQPSRPTHYDHASGVRSRF